MCKSQNLTKKNLKFVWRLNEISEQSENMLTTTKDKTFVFVNIKRKLERNNTANNREELEEQYGTSAEKFTKISSNHSDPEK